ncbi:hypothetical protein TRFO_03826 [Tritrichomonas foetus]|uniref:Uncharacterized protein n=1 Tax=Tritrichomonas foetus TaxID=1144522 RepID=A0A1J4KL18_9EUKA|nr:hypothetical protein TRFO_03826 [Tritrichomonas foetus]|eukprot:OHT11632.1 hypothetical protein TRFO_03826 [Tritrichomonas foetus]
MGCGPSKVDTKLQVRQKNTESTKSTCLVFGMPDCGQDVFISSIEKCFHSVGGSYQSPFLFAQIPSEREARPSWIDEYSKHQRVIASFFFVDISSPAMVLLSVKVINWMRSQLVDQSPPNIVGYVRNQKETNNFTLLKEYLPPNIEASTFNDAVASDIPKYVEFITSCVAKHPPTVDYD